MPEKRDDISGSELRRLLVEKQRKSRQQRLAHFRRTGSVIPSQDLIVPDSDLRSSQQSVDFSNFTAKKAPAKKRKSFLGYLLLLVEVASVASIFWMLISGVGILRKINQNVVLAFELPTPSPTPLVMAVVLPTGHTPPTSPGGARPNDAEIPTHLRPLMQSLKEVPIPTPAVSQAIRIQLPDIRIDAPVIQGTGWEQLKRGVGQYIGSANPGQNGNMVLAAHNDIFGELFRDLDQLERGDQFTVFSNQRAFTYVVMGWEIVDPSQVDVMNPTPDATATLISCYPYLVNTHRIVVKARLVEN